MVISVAEIKNSLFTHIDNPLGLYALIGLFLLLLIYLIRPKPLQKTIPSLIFLMKDTGKSKKESFFERLLRDFLLIFHFLLIAILAMSAMQPYFFSSKDISNEHTVIVLDTSASMLVSIGAGIGSNNLFEKAISKAKSYVAGKTSIVLVDNEPLIVLKDGKEEEATDILTKLKPKAGLSSIGNSILAAGDLLAGEKGRVIVISDFINTDSVEPIIAKKTLEAKGVYVEFVNLNSDAGNKNNIGIVNADLSEKESKITIQNFNEKPLKFDVDINGDKKNVAILPKMNEKITFKNKEGDNQVKLLIKDDFELDNQIHIYTPVKKKIKVLLITNEEKSYILPAISAYKDIWNPEITIETAAPPKMVPIDHDIIILGKIDADKLPKASLDKIKSLVQKKGAAFIVMSFQGLDDLNMKDLLPVTLGNFISQPTEVFNLQSLDEITNDLSFTKTNKYYNAKLKSGAIALANAASDNTTIIAVKDLGSGKIAYYGIIDSESKFKFDVSYPLFWQQLIDYMIHSEDISTINHKIGDKVMFDDETEVKTPSGKLKTAVLDFNEVGEYSIDSRKIYVNLLDSKESDINYFLKDENKDGYESEKSAANIKRRLIAYFIYACIIVLFSELLYIKVRGDL
ncbi:VWA domain-containing protein [Candidatus Woesearchaeota archaeon]|nr:VWA domain-containing protein [Candidatus Woesearchaeota archaeon]